MGRGDGRDVAWLAYVPLPGLALAAVLIRPGDRLVRYHAWQGTLAILGLLLALSGLGFAARLSDARAYVATAGLVSGLVLAAGLVQLGWGLAGALGGRYTRLRPWWDVAAMLKRA